MRNFASIPTSVRPAFQCLKATNFMALQIHRVFTENVNALDNLLRALKPFWCVCGATGIMM